MGLWQLSQLNELGFERVKRREIRIWLGGEREIRERRGNGDGYERLCGGPKWVLGLDYQIEPPSTPKSIYYHPI